MKRVDRNKQTELPFAILFFVLLLMNTLVRTKINQLHWLGDFTTNLSFVIMFIVLLKIWMEGKKYDVSLKWIYVFIGLFMAVFMVTYMTTDYASPYYFAQVIALLILILGLIRYRWNNYQVRAIGYLLAVVTVALLMHWVLIGFPTFGYESVFGNQNYLAVLLFSLLYFNILSIKYAIGLERVLFTGMALLNMVLMLATSARSVLIGSIVIIGAWVIMKHFRRLFPYLIYLVLFGNALFMVIYIGIRGTPIGEVLDQISRNVFNKNLFSGRSELWEGLVGAIAQKPWFGHGIGVVARNVMETSYTAHNIYLQILLESGIIGFAVFFLLILSVWHVLVRQLDQYAAKWSACFMLGILVYGIFELTLFQNNYSISMFQWTIMTFGINFVVLRKNRLE